VKAPVKITIIAEGPAGSGKSVAIALAKDGIGKLFTVKQGPEVREGFGVEFVTAEITPK
jgi:hypothetical protein